MIGKVDEASRALLALPIRSAQDAASSDLLVWVDTAFDGELVVPRKLIDGLALPQTAAVKATLADGSEVVLESFHCWVEWFGHFRQVEVVANDGRLPLLGIGLLRGHKLTVDYLGNQLNLD